jgi:assimilatory nitrate reductase catalytic subunit
MFSDGRYFTPTRRARFVATDPRPPAHRPDAEYPLILNTGRLRDQWHTMTRTGKSPRLAAHKVESLVEVHPDDARQFQLKDGALARLSSRWGAMLARVVISTDQQRGSLFVPMHWSDQNARQGTVDTLVNPATDPVSGQPESKHTPVAIAPWQAAWYGFALSRRRLDFTDAAYCTVATGQQFWRYELAGDQRLEDYAAWVRGHLCAKNEKINWIDYVDKPAGRYRGARLIDDRIESCIFISTSFELPPRTWLAELFTKDELTAQERASLLAGKPAKGMKDAGRIICACFGVGENTIKESITSQNLRTVAAIGQCLKAGTNCGSCIPELKSLLA